MKFEQSCETEMEKWNKKRLEFYENEMSEEDRNWHMDREFEMARVAENDIGAVRAALESRSMLRVGPIVHDFDNHVGFVITLRKKNAVRPEVVMMSYFNSGGLWASMGTEIFAPYEFSMHRYAGMQTGRAPTEYVRRRFTKLMVA